MCLLTMINVDHNNGSNVSSDSIHMCIKQCCYYSGVGQSCGSYYQVVKYDVEMLQAVTDASLDTRH